MGVRCATDYCTVTKGISYEKGFSPYGDNMSAQYWLPRAYVMSVGELSYVKGEAVGTEIEIMALEHPTNGFGKYYAQDAAP